MKTLAFKCLAGLLAMTLSLSPGLVPVVFAADPAAEEAPDTASKEETQAIQQLAKNGYLGEKKDWVLSAKALTEDEVTDLVVKAGDWLAPVDLKALKPGAYRVEDLQALLVLVKDKAEDIRARKLSAWKYQNKLEKMIAALSLDSKEGGSPDTVKKSPAEPPAEVKTAPTAIPGPGLEEFNGMKDDVKDLTKRVGELQTVFDKKLDALQKSNDEVRAANTEIRASNTEIKTSQADIQEQLKLVKRLLDRVQDDLKKTDDHLDQVAKKASEKSMTDVELQQELNIMHKDLRDNTQDVSILKQEVAKLDKTSAQAGESPLDSALNSKWLAGGALLVGITALVISLTRK